MRIRTGIPILLCALLIGGCGGDGEGGSGQLDFTAANSAAKSLGNNYSMDIDFTVGSASEGFNTRGTAKDADGNAMKFCVAKTGGANTPPECTQLPARSTCAGVTISTDVVVPVGSEADPEWVAKTVMAAALKQAMSAAAPDANCQTT